jgi:hypothetical protein
MTTTVVSPVLGGDLESGPQAAHLRRESLMRLDQLLLDGHETFDKVLRCRQETFDLQLEGNDLGRVAAAAPGEVAAGFSVSFVDRSRGFEVTVHVSAPTTSWRSVGRFETHLRDRVMTLVTTCPAQQGAGLV